MVLAPGMDLGEERSPVSSEVPALIADDRLPATKSDAEADCDQRLVEALRSPFLQHARKVLGDSAASDAVLSACISAVDAERHVAFEELLVLLRAAGAVRTSGSDQPCAVHLSNLVYDQLYDFGTWHGAFAAANITFAATIVPLRDDAAAGLLAATRKLTDLCWRVKARKLHPPPGSWIHTPSVWDGLTPAQQEGLEHLAAVLSPPLAEERAEGEQSAAPMFFVKLSTRSPKDSLVLEHRKAALLCESELAAGGRNPTGAEVAGPGDAPELPARGSRVPKFLRGKVSCAFLAQAEAHARAQAAEERVLAVTPERQAAEQQSGSVAMANRSGWEALDLLCSSGRIEQDLDKYVRQRELLPFPISSLQVITRPWVEIPRWAELRGFVVERKLTALSQYYTSEHFPELWAQREVVVEQARDFVERAMGPAMPISHAVVDLVWRPPRGFVVIELNPFGSASGAALFSWTDDRAVLLGEAPFECRISDARALSRWETVEEMRPR